MWREHVWVVLSLSWLCAPAFRPFAITEVSVPYRGQSDERENEKKSEEFQPQPSVDQIDFGWKMTC
jgi:hypothetical protein